MKILHSPQDTALALRPWRTDGSTLGFVPTMGALHDGHLSLVREAKAKNNRVAMSIFVNPTQFGPSEDLTSYPRTLEQDKDLAEDHGVDLLFIPKASTMYPEGEGQVDIHEHRFTDVLCGQFRPGHFSGVCTVVAKLLNIIRPDVLYLGQKDAQQVRVLEALVESLMFPVKVKACPTEREPDGLAMSSRNVKLSANERDQAAGLFQALSSAQKAFEMGEVSASVLIQQVEKDLAQLSMFKTQYVNLLDWDTFRSVETITTKSLLAIAGFFGETRLIDNVILER